MMKGDFLKKFGIYFIPAFFAYLAIKNITSAIMRKSIIAPTKSPIPKFIPLPMGTEMIAFLHSPPGIIAPGIGMMISWTSAETTLPMAAPKMNPIANPKTPAFPIKSLNSAIIPTGFVSGGGGLGVTASRIFLSSSIMSFSFVIKKWSLLHSYMFVELSTGYPLILS